MWPSRNTFSAVQFPVIKKKKVCPRIRWTTAPTIARSSFNFSPAVLEGHFALLNTNFGLTRKHTSTSRRPSERISHLHQSFADGLACLLSSSVLQGEVCTQVCKASKVIPGSQSSHAGRTFPSERKLTVVPAQTRKAHCANKCVSVSGRGF